MFHQYQKKHKSRNKKLLIFRVFGYEILHTINTPNWNSNALFSFCIRLKLQRHSFLSKTKPDTKLHIYKQNDFEGNRKSKQAAAGYP